jgi:hypothetical protein
MSCNPAPTVVCNAYVGRVDCRCSAVFCGLVSAKIIQGAERFAAFAHIVGMLLAAGWLFDSQSEREVILTFRMAAFAACLLVGRLVMRRDIALSHELLADGAGIHMRIVIFIQMASDVAPLLVGPMAVVTIVNFVSATDKI